MSPRQKRALARSTLAWSTPNQGILRGFHDVKAAYNHLFGEKLSLTEVPFGEVRRN
jgi:hypothetical protein